MLGDDRSHSRSSESARRRRDEPLVALLERAEQPLVARRRDAGQRALEPAKSGRRPASRRSSTSASFETPTNGDASTASERLVVVAVVQQAQVREQVDDLLLAEVAAAGRAVGRQAERAQLLLVPLGVGAGGEEQHDLARRRRAGVDELA